MEQCSHNTQCQMQARARIADLRTRDKRYAINLASRRSRSTRTLSDVFIYFAILVRSGTEPLHRGVDHAGVDLLDALPSKAHPV